MYVSNRDGDRGESYTSLLKIGFNEFEVVLS